MQRVIQQGTNRMAGESSARMHTRKISTVLLAASLGAVFRRPTFDALRVPDPEFGGGSICGITNDPTVRGFLFAPDDGAGGGGGVTFTKEQQDKVNEIVQREKADLTAKLKEQKQAFEAKLAEFDTLKSQLGELTTAAEKAREEGELKGKTELEKLQHQFDKAQKALKDNEALAHTKLAELTKHLETERNGRVDDAKRNWATQILSSGAADGAAPYAIQALLNEAEFEIDDKRQITKVTFEGGVFDKPADVASAFYKARPIFAKPTPGGSGHPRGAGGGGAPNGAEGHSSLEAMLQTGLNARAQQGA